LSPIFVKIYVSLLNLRVFAFRILTMIHLCSMLYT